MSNLTGPKHEQARIIGQIQGIYSNAGSLLTPTINQVEFEKAIKEDNISFYFPDVVKGFADKAIKTIDQENDESKKEEILKSSADQLGSLRPIQVVFDKMTKSIFVDVIDLSTDCYKDNAINRKFDRVGKLAK